MEEKNQLRQIYGDAKVLKKCQSDKKFAYVVALARAVNAFNAAHALMVLTGDTDTPAAQRNKMNAYFFTSAVLYEALKLIRSMSAVFGKERNFQNSIQQLLKDKTALRVERTHLKAVRHDAVFHFVPDQFSKAIAATGMSDCVFTATRGTRPDDDHYEFADYIAAEIEIGGRLSDREVVTRMMHDKLELVKQFVVRSQDFIAGELHSRGFKLKPPPF